MNSSLNYRGVEIPFVSFGNVTSDDLFCDKEQELFEFYERNKRRYKVAADIGANLGVHSVIMARQGWAVTAYEPDYKHYSMLRQNIDRNEVMVGSSRVAVLDKDGDEMFVRVLGNTTGSHIKGMKVPYGELEQFPVTTIDAAHIFKWAEFAKIDAEGAEAVILSRMGENKCDCMVEVGSPKNAYLIYSQFKHVPMYAQRLGWALVGSLEDMPTHHSDGALFINMRGGRWN